MQRVVDAAKFNSSDCVKDCGVKAGELLQVARIVTGELRQTKTGVTAILNLTNLESGEVEANVTDSCRGCDEEAVGAWLKSLGAQLAGGAVPGPTPGAVASATRPPAPPAALRARRAVPRT